MTVASERTVRTLSFVPNPGEQLLSVNLAMVDVKQLYLLAEGFGLVPEIVQVAYRSGVTEIHALLWHGLISDAPSNLEKIYDRLSEQLNADAIRFAIAPAVTGLA